METQAAEVDPVPEHGPSIPVNVGQVSIVPLNPEQFVGSLHPVVPVQTHVLLHVVHAALLVAVVLASQSLLIQALLDGAPTSLLQRPSVPPVNA